MPQVFQVLRCYKCSTFQVHQTKKSNKFECKICGEKQSIKRHYGLGTAKECRIQVQKLNGIRGEIDELKETSRDSDDHFDNEHIDVKPNVLNLIPKKSKWSDFVETSEPDPGPNETMYLNDTEVVLVVPKKHRKLGNKSNFKCPSTSKPINSYREGKDNCRESSIKTESEVYRTNASQALISKLPKTHEMNLNFIQSVDSTQIQTKTTNNEIDIKRPPKNWVIPVANNSKWTQFIETGTEYKDQNDCYYTSEIIESQNCENNDKFTGAENSTEDFEQYERNNFHTRKNESSILKNLNVMKHGIQKTACKVSENLDLSMSFVPAVVKSGCKWTQFVETDKYDNEKDNYKSIENVDDNVGNSKKALFALCDDSELDEVLNI